ncbi:MAG TPA: hypothetical protein VFM54_06385 [Micromonosporaceae bacterium]|nr:hypothetical protein [Micromonosporaceae bacterium]
MTYDLSMGQQPAGSGVVFLERALYGFGDVDRRSFKDCVSVSASHTR